MEPGDPFRQGLRLGDAMQFMIMMMMLLLLLMMIIMRIHNVSLLIGPPHCGPTMQH